MIDGLSNAQLSAVQLKILARVNRKQSMDGTDYANTHIVKLMSAVTLRLHWYSAYNASVVY